MVPTLPHPRAAQGLVTRGLWAGPGPRAALSLLLLPRPAMADSLEPASCWEVAVEVPLRRPGLSFPFREIGAVVGAWSTLQDLIGIPRFPP